MESEIFFDLLDNESDISTEDRAALEREFNEFKAARDNRDAVMAAAQRVADAIRHYDAKTPRFDRFGERVLVMNACRSLAALMPGKRHANN